MSGMRVFQAFAAVLLVVLVIGLYRVKTEAVAARGRVEALQEEVAQAQARLQTVKAEAAYLANPARVERLAREKLGLTPGQAAAIPAARAPAHLDVVAPAQSPQTEPAP